MCVCVRVSRQNVVYNASTNTPLLQSPVPVSRPLTTGQSVSHLDLLCHALARSLLACPAPPHPGPTAAAAHTRLDAAAGVRRAVSRTASAPLSSSSWQRDPPAPAAWAAAWAAPWPRYKTELCRPFAEHGRCRCAANFHTY